MIERNRTQRLVFLASTGVIFFTIAFHLDLVGHMAYALEKGRLQADIEHLEQIDSRELAALEKVSHAFSVIARVVKPSVVNIQSYTRNRDLEEFFEENGFQAPPMTGSGSGVIFDADGHIVTNNHVVEDAESVEVVLADGRRYRAEIVGTDPKTDLAVIKIDGDRLHAARLGNSDDVQVGHMVLAIGSPFRLAHSVSHGIISARGRTDVKVEIDYQNWLQTDAPINPGNSGGPLINARGEVIGINTAIATESGRNQGVAFAIPSNTVRRIAEQLRTGEAIVRGYLGVGIEPVSPRVAAAYGLNEAKGVLVTAVGRRTPAANAGLKPEDIILSVGERMIGTREELQQLIAATRPESQVGLLVWRDGERINLSVTVGAQPDGFSTTGTVTDLDRERRRGNRQGRRRPRPQSEAPETTDSIRFGELGMEAANLSTELAEHLRLSPDLDKGVVITRVGPTSEAYLSGLRRGHVLTKVNGRDVKDVKTLRNMLTRDALKQGVRVKIRVGDEDVYRVLQVR